MKCPKCNTINPDNSITCKKCGHIFSFRKVLGMRFFSEILIILFFALTVVGIFGPILTNIQGVFPNTGVRWDANFLYIFSDMWAELLAYRGAGIGGYHLALVRCIFVGLSCVVAFAGVITTLLVSSIKMFQAHHNNQYAKLSIRKMFLYSFIPALQYLVLVRFNFYNSEYNALTGAKDLTHMGWGALLILIGLVAGFIAAVVDEVSKLERNNHIELARYIAFRIVTGLLIVVAFAGTASYINYTFNSVVEDQTYLFVCHRNVFDIIAKTFEAGNPQITSSIISYGIPAVIASALVIVALFFAIYNTFTNRRGLLWISINALVICSIAAGYLSLLSARKYFEVMGGGDYLATLGPSTTFTIAIVVLCIIALGYEYLNEKKGGNFLVKKEEK